MNKQQRVLHGDSFETLLEQVNLNWSEPFLLVCDNSFEYLAIKEYFKPLKNAVLFTEFTPNPLYEDVCKGVCLYQEKNCKFIVAVGGGSAIDVAKCIKLFSTMNPSQNYLKQEFKENDIPLVAVPTTAGTGSESTRYAVIYFNHEKQSITHFDLVPDYVILEPSVLDTLPLFQRKCTLLDALGQAIESYWSVNSTDESKQYSKKAIDLILSHYQTYVEGDNSVNEQLMLASNYSGRAINITQTTAAHAMSYKMSSLFGLPHGYAVALCLPHVWEFMVNHMEQVIDGRGCDYLSTAFGEISSLLGFNEVEEAIDWLKKLVLSFGLLAPECVTEEQIEILSNSVNPVRLGNNPVKLEKHDLKEIYTQIFAIN